jgi:hypothetical protein
VEAVALRDGAVPVDDDPHASDGPDSLLEAAHTFDDDLDRPG